MNAEPIPSTDRSATAAYWFTRQRASNMDAEDLRAFEVWLESGAENKSAFRRVQSMWGVLGGLEDDPAFIDLCGKDERVVVADQQRRVLATAGATLVAAAVGGWVVWGSDAFENLPWFASPPMEEYRTAVGERTNVTLADGSVLTLNTDTVLHVRLSHRERLIELDRGQASFQVAKDKSRPFVVAAGGKTVRATGTQFDVRVEPGRFEVTLIEGRVRVQEQGARGRDAPAADMRQGWRLAVGEDARWRMEPVDLVKETSWHDGMLVFQRDTLAQAVSEMNRYSTRKIVFAGIPPEMPVLGMFRAGDVDGFVRAVEINKLARVTARTEDSVELSAR